MFLRNCLQTSLSAIALFVAENSAAAQEWKSGVEWQEPPRVTPQATNDAPPSDAIVLFDGTNLDQWDDGANWLIADGVAIPQKSQIMSKQHFGDLQLHLEWSSPTEIRGRRTGTRQQRSFSNGALRSANSRFV